MKQPLLIALLLVAPAMAQWGNTTSGDFAVTITPHDPAHIASVTGMPLPTGQRSGVMVELRSDQRADAYKVSLVYRDAAGKTYRLTQVFLHKPSPLKDLVAVDIMWTGRQVTPLSVSVSPITWEPVPVATVSAE